LLLTVLWKHSLGPHDDEPLDIEAVCRAHLDLVLHGLATGDAVPESKPAKKRSRT
jgi:hypothetical protein